LNVTKGADVVHAQPAVMRAYAPIITHHIELVMSAYPPIMLAPNASGKAARTKKLKKKKTSHCKRRTQKHLVLVHCLWGLTPV
jgi:hypothetical protein